jgi:hypothetical protein
MRMTLWMIAKASNLDKLQDSKKPVKEKSSKKKSTNTTTDPNYDKYTTENSTTNKFEIDKFNFDVILMYQNEPNKLVFNLATLIFNVNMDIYIFDGCLNKNNNHSLSYSKTRFAASNVNELPVISICYYMSNYYKTYNKAFYEKHNFYLMRYVGNDNEAKIEISGTYDCNKCMRNGQKKIYLKKYMTMACLECVKNYVDGVIERRSEAYFVEDYNNRECKFKFII